MPPASYAIGLGSNRRHGRHGAPRAVLAAAIDALASEGLIVRAASPVIATRAQGPGGRSFANGAVLVESTLSPPAMLCLLKRIERDFGRRPGRRWGVRVLDLDLLLWSGGRWCSRTLAIPHAHLARRRFVLDPLAAIAPDRWVTGGLRVRHLQARIVRRHGVDHPRPAP